MKANELRIGNYVDYNGAFIDIVDQISFNLIHTKQYSSLEMQKTNPIPLTEEWLLKFGFVEHFNMFIKSYSRNEDNMVSFLGIFFEEKINAWIGYVGNNNTKFSVAINCYFSVHQLQNLYFSLTGEELTLKT